MKRKSFRRVWAGVCLVVPWLVWATTAPADIYRHQDDEGVIHFTNVPNDNRYRLFLKEYEKTTRQTPLKKTSYKGLPPLAPAYASYMPDVENHVAEAAKFYDLDQKLIKAVIQVESNYNPLARSPKGAQGLMQLMPGTARDLEVSDPYNPRQNIIGGSRYLRYLLDLFNNDVSLALAAYNAGPERVNQYRGIPPYLETRSYVEKVLRKYQSLKGDLISLR
ncbi:MAG: lytic transglycosylase domain-containing protein [Desulfobacterota bacterium]|nr:lytic transglycosylase domain-containing protein [Thermodesulfobacteriota bacterium]